MPTFIQRPSGLLLPPTSFRLPSGHEVRPVDGTPLLKVRHDLDLPPGVPKVRVSAFTDDPNRASPVVLRFHADEFETSSTEGGLVGPNVAVKMNAQRSNGDWIYSPEDERMAATTAYVAVRSTLDAAEDLLRMKIPWGDGKRLEVGKYETDSYNLNAHYDPTTRSLSIGHAIQPGADQTEAFDPTFRSENLAYNLALAPDVLAHEAGHAVFDVLKPITALELSSHTDKASLNEGIADCFAFLTALKQGTVLGRALSDTALDLSRPNALSEIGDSLGEVFAYGGMPSDGPLRSLINSKVREPGKVYEEHEGGEIIGGAFYDLFLAIHAQNAKLNTPRSQALSAGDSAGAIFLNALKFTPDDGNLSFEDFGRGVVLAALKLSGGKYQGQVRDVLVKRNLLSASEVDATIARHAQRQQFPLRIDPSTFVGKAQAEALLPELRQTFGLKADAVLEPSRVERDDYGFTRIVYFQPRANKAAELADEELNQAYGAVDRDALLSRGAFTVVFDPRGKVVTAFNQIDTGVNINIAGKLGDGSPAAVDTPMLSPSALDHDHD